MMAWQVVAHQAGREVAAAGIVAAREVNGWPGGWVATMADGREVHSDHLWIRWHSVIAALASK